MTNVVMPQMGESIAEGTIVRWIKKVGDSIDRDEPLFEISTDKVDAEIPSPAAGVLTEIKVKEGETVPVNSVVATIGTAGEVRAKSEAPEPPVPEAAVGQAESPAATPASVETDIEESESDTAEGLRRQKSSPLVRKIAHEHNVDLTQVHGTGLSGRVTKQDILGYIQLGKGSLGTTASAPDPAPPASAEPVPEAAAEPAPAPAAEAAPAPAAEPASASAAKPVPTAAAEPAPAPAAKPASAPAAKPAPAPVSEPAAGGPTYKTGENVQVVPMSVMRKKIAEHMVLSAHTSPHVYSVYEVNFGRVAMLRDQKKAAYEAGGAKLTYTAFIAKVTIDALRQFPIVNASLDRDNIVYKKDINLGIAVALDNGLIVPVIRNADEKNLLGLSRAINDLANRARAKKLNPEEVQSGTFTITNPGIFGALYGMPLINQPQVAILGVGSIDKRAVVVDDAIAIKPVCHITLGHDHRLVDGADAGRFLSFVKDRLENFDEAWM